MGLTGFYRLLEKQGHYTPDKVHLHDLKDKTIALDGDFFIYKAMHGSTTGTDFTPMDIGNRILTWLRVAETAGIHTIFVTTGGTVPVEKKNHCEVLRKRKRKQQEVRIQALEEQLLCPPVEVGEDLMLRDRLCRMRDGIRRVDRTLSTDVVKYIQSHGFDCRVAVSEADFLLVLLSEDGSCDYVATDDADIIVSGAHCVIRDLANVLMNVTKMARVFCRKDILTHLKLTSAEFVQLGVLLSCDYQPPLKNVGPVTALRMIREFGTVESFLASDTFQGMTKQKKRKYNVPETMTMGEYVLSSQRSVEIMTSRPDLRSIEMENY
jgi:5'-3' exonuclease